MEQDFEKWVEQVCDKLEKLENNGEYDEFLDLFKELELQEQNIPSFVEFKPFKARVLFAKGEYYESIQIFQEVVESTTEAKTRMLSAGLIISILLHNILKNEPRPFTPEYDMTKKYLEIMFKTYDEADEESKMQLRRSHDVEELRKILIDMKEGREIGGYTEKVRGSLKTFRLLLVISVLFLIISFISLAFIPYFIISAGITIVYWWFKLRK